MSCCCPACADFMSLSVRAVYHHNDVDLTAAAYRIGICIKNGVRKDADLVVAGPTVPWFADGFVMVEMFFC